MAIFSAENLAELRRFIDEPTDAVYSDADLTLMLTNATSLTGLASEIWLEKAARYSRLVDMQEGTSRRSLSQLQKQALAMATHYNSADGTPPATGFRRATTRPIERV